MRQIGLLILARWRERVANQGCLAVGAALFAPMLLLLPFLLWSVPDAVPVVFEEPALGEAWGEEARYERPDGPHLFVDAQGRVEGPDGDQRTFLVVWLLDREVDAVLGPPPRIGEEASVEPPARRVRSEPVADEATVPRSRLQPLAVGFFLFAAVGASTWWRIRAHPALAAGWVSRRRVVAAEVVVALLDFFFFATMLCRAVCLP